MRNDVLLLLIAAAIPILCRKMDVYPEVIPKIIFTPHGAPSGGLFGYSVAYRKNSKSLIVGAPKGSPTGDIHNCDIYRGTCTIMKLNDAHPTMKNDSHWLGATVGASSSFIVGCAPRIRTFDNEEGMFGGCYYQRSSDFKLAKEVSKKKLSEEILKNYDENDKVRWGTKFNSEEFKKKKNSMHKEFAMTSFGWSMHVTQEEKVLVGGPAMMFGRAMVYDDDETYPELIILDNKELKKTNANIEHNFGYAVVSGKFFNGEIDYAISSTYGDIGNGKILFFTSSKLQYMGVAILDSQPGAMFGAALCAGHLKGPYETLLVGAPARVDASRQLGAVHVYIGRGKQMQEKRTLWGYKENSFFGSAFANLGDMNGDKQDDIAVAAPYEDGGAVYIYSGSDLSGNAPVVQRIAYMQRIAVATSQTSPPLPISLTALDDYDGNGCNELAIGVPKDNQVVLLRCPAFIVIDLVSDLPEQLDLNRMNFDFKLCLKVTFGTKSKYIETKLEMQIKVSSNVKIPDRDRVYTIDLDVTKIEYCKSIPVSLLKDADYDTPITFDVSVAGRNPTTEFNERQVIISDLSKTTLQERLMAPGSNLQLEVTTTLTDDYIIGSTSEEQIQVLLTNRGRVAHHACVRGLVTGACPKSVSEHCDLKGNEFVCKLKELFRNGESKKYDIILDAKKMTSAAMNVQIVTKLYRVCDGEEYDATTKQLHLKTDRRINISGTSTQPLNVTKMELKYGNQIVKHLYTIINNGITKWENVTCQIWMPPGCSVSISDHECNTKKNPATCTISKIDKNDTVSVVVMFTVLPGATIGKFPGKAIASNLVLHLATETISLSVRTPINLREVAVAIWIIVVASIVGLLLLVIFALILRECGCFRRKNKEKLEKLKEVKKRESVIQVRNSAMAKLMDELEDRQKLVGVHEDDEFSNEKRAPAHDSDPGYSEPPKSVTTNADIHRT